MDSDEGEQEVEEEEEGEIDTNELLADLEDCFGSDEAHFPIYWYMTETCMVPRAQVNY
jgi:hypothetical protein